MRRLSRIVVGLSCLLVFLVPVYAESGDSVARVWLQSVEVRPDSLSARYRRRGNPAVEWARRVIACRDSFSLRLLPAYSCDYYSFTSLVRESDSLPIMLREQQATTYYRRSPHHMETVVRRQHGVGLDMMVSWPALEEQLQRLTAPVDLYDPCLMLLGSRFISPVSSMGALTVYHYELGDTLLVENEPCLSLYFSPATPSVYALQGVLYVGLNDAALRGYCLEIPNDNGLNFVEKYELSHRLRKDSSGRLIPQQTDIRARLFFPVRRFPLQLTRTDIFLSADSSAAASRIDRTQFIDSLPYRAEMSLWDSLRPIPLSLPSVSPLEANTPSAHRLRTGLFVWDALSSDYVPTVSPRRWGESKWDFGPLLSTVSWNPLEGVRLRVGGTTTARLHPHWFASGYVAFGTTDLRPKYNATVMYSFYKKKYSPFYPRRHYLALSAQYDVEQPGYNSASMERDNILLSIPTGPVRMGAFAYQFRARLDYRWDFANYLSLRTYFDYSHTQAAGSLSFLPFHGYEHTVRLSYTPGRYEPLSRRGLSLPYSLRRRSPELSFLHTMGYLDERASGGTGYWCHHTTFTADYRLYLATTALDMRAQLGGVWGRAPLMRLYFPAATTGWFLGSNSFNLLRPMEQVYDRYAAWYLTWHLNGCVLGRIPGVRRLDLRGVVSFSGITGTLSSRNRSVAASLSRMPDSAIPYMELTAGIENIFHFLRIDYVRRLTYVDYTASDGVPVHLPAWGRNGLKLSACFEF